MPEKERERKRLEIYYLLFISNFKINQLQMHIYTFNLFVEYEYESKLDNICVENYFVF